MCGDQDNMEGSFHKLTTTKIKVLNEWEKEHLIMYTKNSFQLNKLTSKNIVNTI